MTYHLRKLMKKEYTPKMWSFPVRRPDHHPEGVVSIENTPSNGQMSKPILSMQRQVTAEGQGPPLEVQLNATTCVQLHANRHIHGWIRQRFGGDEEAQNTRIIARAQQFSSFVLMIGSMNGPHEFLPREAILIANKDEALLQLLCEELPTAQAFKKSIESLSSEQREFAKAFRSMQLQSTLFAMCIVQVKPALEAVLNLPDDSLTKEIKLSQQLMRHLITYQIPSDQLSCDLDDDMSAYECDIVDEEKAQELLQMMKRKDKVNRVRQLAQEMESMLEEAKQEELNEAKLVAKMDKATQKLQRETLFSEYRGGRKKESESIQSSAFGGSCWNEDSKDMELCGGMAEIDCLKDGFMDDMVMEEPAQEEQPEAKNDDMSEDEPKEPLKANSLDDTDITSFPVVLNNQLELLDHDAAVHSTILKCAPTWRKSEQKALLAPRQTREIDMDAAKAEKNKAFDLLDALSRSGGLALCATDLHVIIAGTHTFTRSLIDYVVQENSNPIEKLERSALILGSVIYGIPAEELVKPEHLPALRKGASAHLFADVE